jgi:hypothetical protein
MPLSDFLVRNYPKSKCKFFVSTYVIARFPGAHNREILDLSMMEPWRGGRFFE